MFNTDTNNNDDIIYNCKDGIEYIQFKRLLEYGIKHAYTLKGEEIDFTLNSKYESESNKKISSALEIDVKSLVKPTQTHSSNVICIDRVLNRNNENDLKYMENVDGIITNKKGISLVTTNADCILFLIYDPVQNVIANIHSGWRGTFQRILEKAIVKMITAYKSNPKDLIICISPCIRKCHFEVDEDVKLLCEFLFGFTKRKDEFIFKCSSESGTNNEKKQKYMIDTVQINKILLENLGVKEENIIDCKLCSVCNSSKINSYRVDGKNFKRSIALICL